MSQTKTKLQAAWTDTDMYATSLLLLFVDAYGTDPLAGKDAAQWHDATIKMQIEEDLNIRLPQDNFDRLMVAKNLLSTDDFYQSLPDFIQWCNILSGDTYDPRVWDPADSSEIAWGITEAVLIEPPETEEPFNAEIRAYIGAVLDAEGIITPPDVLRMATRNGREFTATISAGFTDDPEMFAGIYGFEAQKTTDINDYVRQSLARLSDQLERLPLRVGNAKDAVQQVLRVLGKDMQKT